jgi:hypothetical protein
LTERARGKKERAGIGIEPVHETLIWVPVERLSLTVKVDVPRRTGKWQSLRSFTFGP